MSLAIWSTLPSRFRWSRPSISGAGTAICRHLPARQVWHRWRVAKQKKKQIQQRKKKEIKLSVLHTHTQKRKFHHLCVIGYILPPTTTTKQNKKRLNVKKPFRKKKKIRIEDRVRDVVKICVWWCGCARAHFRTAESSFVLCPCQLVFGLSVNVEKIKIFFKKPREKILQVKFSL